MKQEELSKDLIEFLQGERIVSLVTIDKNSNLPTISTISWLVAQENGKKLHFAVGHNAESAKNIQSNPNVVLNVIATENTFEITGEGKVSDICKGTMKYRVITVEIKSVMENMFYGGEITEVPKYKKMYDPKLAKQLDDEIYHKLKNEH